MKSTRAGLAIFVFAALAFSACENTTDLGEAGAQGEGAQEASASITWNARAGTLLSALPAGSQGPAVRILTYLSLAQYRALRAAEAAKNGSLRPSETAAVGAASVVVLSSFFPDQATALQTQLDNDLNAEPAAKHQDNAAGAAVGRTVGAAVLAQMATDGFNTLVPTPQTGPGKWVPGTTAIVRALYGVRPFFMTSGDELRAPPPPVFGSAQFLAELAIVRNTSDTRTAEQLAIAQQMNQSVAPFVPGTWNALAVDLIKKYHRKEKDAVRILAYSNAAMFDAMIACWDSKFYYWYIRPSQADPAITLPIGLPNHPSYPSGHSCVTSGMLNVLIDAFPMERANLEAIIEKAGISRVYAGIHYMFDINAGREIGTRAAQLARRGSLE